MLKRTQFPPHLSKCKNSILVWFFFFFINFNLSFDSYPDAHSSGLSTLIPLALFWAVQCSSLSFLVTSAVLRGPKKWQLARGRVTVVPVCPWAVPRGPALVVMVEACGCSLPCCVGAFLAPHEVVGHKRCEAVGNATSDCTGCLSGADFQMGLSIRIVKLKTCSELWSFFSTAGRELCPSQQL